MRTLFFLILILAQIPLFPLAARASETESSAWDKGRVKPVVSSGKRAAVGREVIAGKVKRIYLYCVTDGKVRKKALGKDVFKTEEGVRVNGHVCGILVFCAEDLRADLDGRPLSKIRNNGDGSVSLRHFGKLTPEEIASSDSDRAYYETLLSGTERRDEGPVMVPGAYSWFPRVTGDPVSLNETFQITFEAKGKALALPVSHQTYRGLSSPPSVQGSVGDVPHFRYLGTRLERLKERAGDLDKRLKAISQGIASVEKTFDLHLVDNVNILDYDEAYNAVTCREKNDIWFYAETFLREPLDQLTGMAAHESLHVCVNIKALAENGDVRQLFADLKGYDEFSEERFMTTAMGVVPPKSARAGDDRELFFAFIDERNFLYGMTGGHSRDNIEEFCVSLFHSMMFLDRFEQNLDHSLSVPGMGKHAHFLTLEERAAIAESYVEAIQVMSEALKEKNPGSHRNVPDPSEAFVSGTLAEARTIRGRPVQGSLLAAYPRSGNTKGGPPERQGHELR